MQLAKLQSGLDMIESLFSKDEYPKSRGLCDKLIKEWYFHGCQTPHFKHDSPFMQGIESASVDRGSLAKIIALSLKLMDFYARLHRWQKPNYESPWGAEHVMLRLQSIFPGHLASQLAFKSIMGQDSPQIITNALRKYGNENFVAYDKNNLEGNVNDNKITFVDRLIGNIETERGYVAAKVLAGNYTFYLTDDDLSSLEMFIASESNKLGQQNGAIYRSLMKTALEQYRIYVQDAERKFVSTYEEKKGTFEDLKNSLIDIKARSNDSLKFLRSVAQDLPGLFPDIDLEIWNLLVGCNEFYYIRTFDGVKRHIRCAQEELNNFLKDTSIHLNYRNRNLLLAALKNPGVYVRQKKLRRQTQLEANEGSADIFTNPQAFFLRLRQTIEYGKKLSMTPAGKKLDGYGVKIYCENINEAINCARWDLGEEHILLVPIDEGAFMHVYIGIHKSENLDNPQPDYFKAIKIRKPMGSRGDLIIERAGVDLGEHRREDIVDLIKHPNICSCRRHTRTDGSVYFEEELFYETVTDRVEKCYTYNAKELKSALIEILSGLEECHKNGIIHRDIKPDNIGIKIEDNNGRGTLTKKHMISDFGISTICGPDSYKGEFYIGSLLGMAPEAYDPKIEKDARADLFSVGVVAFYMAVREYHYFIDDYKVQFPGITPTIQGMNKAELAFTPGKGRTNAEAIVACLKQNMGFYDQSLRYFKEKTKDEKLTRVLARLLHPDPNQRYKSAGDALVDLKG